MVDDDRNRPELDAVTEWTGGCSWIAYLDERGQRASHALNTDEGVWLVDPVDARGLDDTIAVLGDVAGVVVLQDRHSRDSAAVARRHGVAVHLPEWVHGEAENLDAPVERIGNELPGTAYRLYELLAEPDWQEAVLVDETESTLVVPEAVGTLASFGADDGTLGVHLSLEEPPWRLADWLPDKILVGHGESVHRNAVAQLTEALDRS
jgi:hypothetical protein